MYCKYAKEFYRLKTRLDLNEYEAFSIACYKERLKWEIKERLAVQSFQNLDDLILAAQCVEQLTERGKSKSHIPHSAPTIVSENPRPSVTSCTSYNGRTSSMAHFLGLAPRSKGASLGNPYRSNVVTKYYRCNEEGHQSNVC